MISYEQQARDMLERCGWDGAQGCTAADVIEVANLLQERDRLRTGPPDQCVVLSEDIPQGGQAFGRIEDVEYALDGGKRLGSGVKIAITRGHKGKLVVVGWEC